MVRPARRVISCGGFLKADGHLRMGVCFFVTCGHLFGYLSGDMMTTTKDLQPKPAMLSWSRKVWLAVAMPFARLWSGIRSWFVRLLLRDRQSCPERRTGAGDISGRVATTCRIARSFEIAALVVRDHALCHWQGTSRVSGANLFMESRNDGLCERIGRERTAAF